MHPARLYHESDPATLCQRILDHPFAVITAISEGRPLAAHTPVLPCGHGLPCRGGETLSLRFHLSAANPVTHALLAGSPALAVFTGVHGYVSPDWYGIDDQVPTWNYVSVEAEGPVVRLDETATRQLIDDLSDYFESQLAPKPVWTSTKMTPARLGTMLRGIVAFDLAPTRFEGITKLNQNKPAAARAGVIESLEMTKSGASLATEMRKIES